ncbi:MAG: hypothetical protein OXH15_05135 [Gammaproteobacteria bacterium]|nr:hypothetical protein [Gammaproteobacteria bacterium]
MKSLGAFLMAIGVVAAGFAFLLALSLGIFLLPDASPVGVLWAWDGVLIGFLFFRVWGIATDLRVDDVLSMHNFLHLPLNPGDVFVLNVVALHVQPSPLIFGAALLGLSLASVFALGPAHVILLPLALAAFWCVIAVTRQLQTFVAALMVNKRRRGTIVAVSFLVAMLLIQAPNIYVQVGLWSERDQPDPVPAEQENGEALAPGEVSRWLLIPTLAVPPGWLAYGAYQAKQDRYWPAALATLGFLAITGWSLSRSYRSTLQVYRHTERARARPRHRSASSSATRRRRIADAYWGVFPTVPAAIGRASLRQWFRSPQGKYGFLAPIMAFAFVLVAALRFEDMAQAQPYLGVGLAAFCCAPAGFANNVFGWDRGGFRVLLAAAPPRHLVLLGKHLGLIPITLGPGFAALVVVQLGWPQPATHFFASMLQLALFCLVVFMVGTHFSITDPWAASFNSLKQRGEAMASNLGAFFAAAFAVGVMMLAIAALLAVERLLAGAAWTIPVYLVASMIELAFVAAWYRRVLLRQARALPAQEDRILEAITTPVD